MKKIAIITGANGFIGSRLLFRLAEEGWEVHAIGRDRESNVWRDRVHFAISDLGDYRELPGRLRCHQMLLDESLKIDLGKAWMATIPEQSATLIHVAGNTRFNPHTCFPC